MKERTPAEPFGAAFEAAQARLSYCIKKACAPAIAWPEQVVAAIGATLDFAAQNPAAADVLTNQALAHGPDGMSRYQRLLRLGAERLRAGRDERPDGEQLPDVLEPALIGGVATLVAQRLQQGRESELPDLAPDVIEFVLGPYLGPERAQWAIKCSKGFV